MYYKIENKDCKVYQELHALRTHEKQIEKENIEAITEKVGLDWKMEFGHTGQQNFRRVSSLMGFGFLEPEKVAIAQLACSVCWAIGYFSQQFKTIKL